MSGKIVSDQQPSRSILAQIIAESRPRTAKLIAEMMLKDGIQSVSSQKEKQLFWQKNPDVNEQELWAKHMMAAGTDPNIWTVQQQADIALAVSKELYPWRWEMADKEGRSEPSQQAMWAYSHARRGPPKDIQEQAPEPQASSDVTGEGGGY